jgi:hypothetical protein
MHAHDGPLGHLITLSNPRVPRAGRRRKRRRRRRRRRRRKRRRYAGPEVEACFLLTGGGGAKARSPEAPAEGLLAEVGTGGRNGDGRGLIRRKSPWPSRELVGRGGAGRRGLGGAGGGGGWTRGEA